MFLVRNKQRYYTQWLIYDILHQDAAMFIDAEVIGKALLPVHHVFRKFSCLVTFSYSLYFQRKGHETHAICIEKRSLNIRFDQCHN